MIHPQLLPLIIALVIAVVPLSQLNAQAASSHDHIGRLIAAMLGDTPLLRDLAVLTDEIGGRATGSQANLRSVEWGLDRFREAGVAARRETFAMPSLWLERSASANVEGEGVSYSPRVAAMPFSSGTTQSGITRPLLDAGFGTAEAFQGLGAQSQDAFVLVETVELTDIAGLFREYTDAAGIEARAFAAGVAGVVYVGSRPSNVLYRHNVSIGTRNTRPMLVMERDAALRALRLLRSGKALTLSVKLDIEDGPAYESYNVIGEIRGATRPGEVVIIGAHLDSWDLGTGALDNGANVAMMIDIARQMRRLDLQPARTVRFALWNGEEQGMNGSFGYTELHNAELDGHMMALSVDIGCGRITGFFTGGRAELVPQVELALEPVAGLGPFQHINVPVVGTDNFDFMLHGIPNLVANHEPATYGPNYHAGSDQFAECDPRQLRLNAAVVAALTYGFAESETSLARQTRAEIERLVSTTSLGQQMRTFNLWEGWVNGSRGRRHQN